MGNTAVDRVPDPGLCLIGNGDDGLAPVGLRYMSKKLGHVAGTEDFVYSGEARRTLLRAEVGREDAVGGALSPEELAGTAG